MNDPGPYVRPRNFERYVHYGKRRPTWIKLYTLDLLREVEWLELTFGERGLLVGIWQIEAENRCNGGPNEFISRRSLARCLGQRVFTQHLQTLSDAGFIEFLASEDSA
jgi:hypothetical protein